jgi:hypothetical protein
MRVQNTPWSRGALTDEQREALRLHLAHGLELALGSAGSPHRFVITAYRAGNILVERRDVGRTVLFERIGEVLAEAGEPLRATA